MPLTARAILLFVSACGACGDDEPRADAGADAGARDAGHDAGRRDSGRVDVGLDAADAGSADPGWVRMAGPPEWCRIDRAETPEALWRGRWEPCGDGCERLVSEPERQQAIDSSVSWTDGEEGWFSIVQEVEGGARGILLVSTRGRIAGAWREPERPATDMICLAGAPVGVGDGFAAIGLEARTSSGPQFWGLYRGPLDDIGSADTPTAVLDETVLVGSNTINSLKVSATTVIGALQPMSQVLVFEGGDMVRRAGIFSATPGTVQRMALVGRTAYWEEWGSSVRASFASYDRAEAVFREITGNILSFNAAPEGFAWLEGYDRSPEGVYARVELWTAGYTEEPADLAPRSVVELPEYDTSGKAGGGHFAFVRRAPRQRVEIYDLADGRHRTWYLPSGFSATAEAPLYLTETEMLVAVAPEGPVSRGTVLRVDLTRVPYE